MSTTKADAIRPFTFHAPQAELDELRRRIATTRWPTRERVQDRSQGVQLATLRELARYWSSEYDWRKCEARLNALPQFTTEIDGVEIHFIHVRSRHENALPLIMTHGWPGSVIELLDTVGPLTDPTSHGGTPEDAFDEPKVVAIQQGLPGEQQSIRATRFQPLCAQLSAAFLFLEDARPQANVEMQKGRRIQLVVTFFEFPNHHLNARQQAGTSEASLPKKEILDPVKYLVNSFSASERVHVQANADG